MGLWDAFDKMKSAKKPAPEQPQPQPQQRLKFGPSLPALPGPAAPLKPAGGGLFAAFDVWKEKKSELAPIKEGKGGFSVFTPPDQDMVIPGAPSRSSEPDPFDVWRDRPKPKDITDALVPRGEAGSLYAPERELFVPEPEVRPREESERFDELKRGVKDLEEKEAKEDEEGDEDYPTGRSENKKLADIAPWIPPSTEDMLKVLKEIFDMDEFWDSVRAGRDEDHFIAQLEEGQDEFGGEGARYELQTVCGADAGSSSDGTYIEELLTFFGIPLVEVDGYLQAWEAEEYDMGEAQEVIMEEVFYPLCHVVSDAFESTKPKGIPGHIDILDYHEGLVNIVYVETQNDYSPREFKKRVAGAVKERADEEERREVARRERDASFRKFLGSWRVPSADEMLRFLGKKYNLPDLIAQIRKAKKAKSWQMEMADRGEADFPIQQFGAYDDPGQIVEIAVFLGIPDDIIQRSDSRDDEHVALWEHVVSPVDDAIVAAFERALPDDLSGAINIYEDADGMWVLGYHEYAG